VKARGAKEKKILQVRST